MIDALRLNQPKTLISNTTLILSFAMRGADSCETGAQRICLLSLYSEAYADVASSVVASSFRFATDNQP